MTDAIPMGTVFWALANRHVVRSDQNTRYRLKDNHIEVNSIYTGGNWNRTNNTTPLMFSSMEAVEYSMQEHYCVMDVYDAIKNILSNRIVVNDKAIPFKLGQNGELLAYYSDEKGWEIAKLGDLRGSMYWEDRRNEFGEGCR